MLLSLTCAGSLSNGPAISYEDLHKLAFVFGPQVSPDGSRVAYTFGRTNFDQDRRESRIEIYDVASKETHPLPVSRIAVHSPQWSPDGKWLAFCAFDSDMTMQVFASPSSGGDELQISHSKTGVETYSWSPDGKLIAYTAEEEPASGQGTERFNSSFEVGNDPFGSSSLEMPIRLWVVPSSGGAAVCLGKEGRPLQNMLPPATPTCAPEWSRDSKYVFVVSQHTPSYGDAWWTNRIERVTVADGKMTPVTNAPGFELSVAASPTDDRIVYWAQPNTKSEMNRLLVSDVGSGAGVPGKQGREISSAFDINAFLGLWMPDGRSFLTGGDIDDTVGLWTLDLSGKAHRLDLGDVVPSNSFGLDVSVSRTGAIAFAGSSATSPSELYYMATPESKPIAITHANDWLGQFQLGETRTLKWKTDEFEANGIVTLPPDFEATKRYPVVVLLHGGPQMSSHKGFGIENQFLAGQGFVVFEPNYRGSDNLGEKYMQAIWNDAGDGPGRDVMAGLKRLEQEPWIDSKRESLAGWSYGGFMTAWLMGHEHKWKCAMCGGAILDWSAMRALSDFGPMVDLGFRGKLWKDGLARDFAEQSPISYMNRMTTPTLILADTGDQRAPTAQSYVLYQGLRERGIPVKFVLYPVSSHFPSDPVLIIDILRRTVDWVEQWSK